MISPFAAAVAASLSMMSTSPENNLNLASQSDYRTKATLSESFGVQAATFAQMTESFRTKSNDHTLVPCEKSFNIMDKSVVSQRLAECLVKSGRSALTKDFFKFIFDLKHSLLIQESTAQSEKIILFLSYLEDLTRQNLSSTQNSAWYDLKKGFLEIPAHQRNKFEFQDGDLVIAYGSMGTSAIVTQTSVPTSQYSHALLVRKRNGVFTTLESQPHTATREFSEKEFSEEKYFHMAVFRWKDPKKREEIARKVSDLAYRWTKENIPYDLVADWEDDSKLNCVELAAKAYAQAANLKWSDLIHDRSEFIVDNGKDIAHDVGLHPKNIITSRSFFRSSELELVAEYRNTDDLLQTWRLFAIMTSTLNRYADGFHIKPDPFFLLLNPILKWSVVDVVPLLKKSRILSGMLGHEQFSRLATFEKKISAPVIEEMAFRSPNHNLLDESLFDLLSSAERLMSSNSKVGAYFEKRVEPLEIVTRR